MSRVFSTWIRGYGMLVRTDGNDIGWPEFWETPIESIKCNRDIYEWKKVCDWELHFVHRAIGALLMLLRFYFCISKFSTLLCM